MPPGRCGSCGGDIDWITTVAGKLMPVNLDNYLLVVGPGRLMGMTWNGRALRGRRADWTDLMDPRSKLVQVRTSHFATCPQARHHRRRR